MARRAERAAAGFKRLKLKLGGRDGLDVERVRAVRGGHATLPLQVDVNEYWSLDEALEALPQLRSSASSTASSRCRPATRAGAKLKRRSPIPIYVDEDCHTLATSPLARELAHGINIKLAKSGGIREAVRMAHAARALGLGVMLGCMIESGLGIAAGARSRASATTSTSTATCCSPTIRGPASSSSTASRSPPTSQGSASEH